MHLTHSWANSRSKLRFSMHHACCSSDGRVLNAVPQFAMDSVVVGQAIGGGGPRRDETRRRVKFYTKRPPRKSAESTRRSHERFSHPDWIHHGDRQLKRIRQAADLGVTGIPNYRPAVARRRKNGLHATPGVFAAGTHCRFVGNGAFKWRSTPSPINLAVKSLRCTILPCSPAWHSVDKRRSWCYTSPPISFIPQTCDAQLPSGRSPFRSLSLLGVRLL